MVPLLFAVAVVTLKVSVAPSQIALVPEYPSVQVILFNGAPELEYPQLALRFVTSIKPPLSKSNWKVLAVEKLLLEAPCHTYLTLPEVAYCSDDGFPTKTFGSSNSTRLSITPLIKAFSILGSPVWAGISEK